MSKSVKAFSGWLGWGRSREGLELYATVGGRWDDRLRKSLRPENDQIGDILTDHMMAAGVFEGQSVIVLVLPGRRCELSSAEVLRRIAEFAEDPEAVASMSREELHAELAEEGIDLTQPAQQLRDWMAATRRADALAAEVGMICAWVLVNCGHKAFRKLLRDILAWEIGGRTC